MPEQPDYPRGDNHGNHPDFEPLDRCECSHSNDSRKPIESPVSRHQDMQTKPHRQIKNDAHNCGGDT